MESNLFVYTVNGCIDLWAGMTPLLDYIRLSHASHERGESYHYTSEEDLKLFLRACFIETLMLNTFWEGDIGGEDIAISGIPRAGNNPYKLIAFKQKNNGCSFLVSECPIFYSEIEAMTLHTTPKTERFSMKDMYSFFYHSFDLVERLFDAALLKGGDDAEKNYVGAKFESVTLARHKDIYN